MTKQVTEQVTGDAATAAAIMMMVMCCFAAYYLGVPHEVVRLQRVLAAQLERFLAVPDHIRVLAQPQAAHSDVHVAHCGQKVGLARHLQDVIDGAIAVAAAGGMNGVLE